jgi:hypothetical protein
VSLGVQIGGAEIGARQDGLYKGMENAQPTGSITSTRLCRADMSQRMCTSCSKHSSGAFDDGAMVSEVSYQSGIQMD